MRTCAVAQLRLLYLRDAHEVKQVACGHHAAHSRMNFAASVSVPQASCTLQRQSRGTASRQSKLLHTTQFNPGAAPLTQVAQGKVRNVTAANAAQLMQEGWVLLDVRPPQEIEKAGVKGAVEVRHVRF